MTDEIAKGVVHKTLIIGSGPAGLSAAINLKTYNKNFLWFGNAALSDKVGKAELVNNYPGMYGVSGKELQQAFVQHKDAMGLEITDKIRVEIEDIPAVHDAVEQFASYIGQQTLATEVVCVATPSGETVVTSDVNDIPLQIAINKQ